MSETGSIGAPPRPGSDIISRTNSILYACNTIKQQFDTHREKRSARSTYTLSITSSDRAYFQVQAWLINQIQIDKQRALKAFGTGMSLRFLFDDSNAQTIRVDGHPIVVASEKPNTGMESLKAELVGGDSDRTSLTEPRIVFIAKTREGFEAIKTTLVNVREEGQKTQTEPPRLHYSTGFYENHSQPLRPRSVDSVVLAEGQMERILDDLGRFLKSEQTYIERGIPWQRGYLFYGPPGTGKTSLAKVLAGHFNLDVYYISLGAISNDTELMKVLSRASERSIVLFEDIDVFKGVKDREGDSKNNSFSLSGFLNALDGVLTPHGMIKIMTTNEKSVIDPAVLRPGRVDLAEELGYLTGKQSDRMFHSFFGVSPSQPLMLERVSPSSMMEVLKNHMFDPEAAEAEIRERLSS